MTSWGPSPATGAVPATALRRGGCPRPRTVARQKTRAAIVAPAARRSRVSEYLGLLRPRILALVAFTAAPIIVSRHASDAWRIAALLLATALLGASCDAFNAFIERGSDALMERTRLRPLAAHRLEPSRAFAFATACASLSLALFGALHPLASVAAALVLAHYVVVYSLWLKRRTPLNIVIGGAAGGAAPLLADLALDGRVGAASLLLFAIVTAWTPPHFWAIALFRKHEYAAAGIPMLPVVAGDRATRDAMLRWTCVLLPLSLAPVLVHAAGATYAACALALGAGLLRSMLRARRLATPAADRAAFLSSVRYLALLVAAWSVDALLELP